jgi:hypothetical protein
LEHRLNYFLELVCNYDFRPKLQRTVYDLFDELSFLVSPEG